MVCPYPCGNKNEYGYCMSTGCINIQYAQQIFYSHNPQFDISPKTKDYYILGVDLAMVDDEAEVKNENTNRVDTN